MKLNSVLRWTQLTFFIGIAFSVLAMEKAADNKVYVANESSWPVELTYKKKGKDLTLRLAIGSGPKELGKISEISELTYGTYGAYYQTAFSKKYPLVLTEVLTDKDLLITISTKYGIWDVKYSEYAPTVKTPIAAKMTDPWDAFPDAKAYKESDKKKAYRRIFLLGSSYTPSDLETAYRATIFKWHPDKNIGNEEFANSVSQLIQEANEGLKPKA